MKLRELIDIEEKLMKIELSNIFQMHFNEIILLKSYLNQIGEITNIYFNLVRDYSEKIIQDYPNLSHEEKKNIVQEYNNSLLKSEVHAIANYQDILIFLDKYKTKFTCLDAADN